jgi:hypothetical protein
MKVQPVRGFFFDKKGNYMFSLFFGFSRIDNLRARKFFLCGEIFFEMGRAGRRRTSF